MIKKFRLILFGTVLSIWAGACTDDTFSDTDSVRTEGNAHIRLSVTIPDAEIVRTRAGGTGDESVENLDVLLFDNTTADTDESKVKLIAHRSITDMTVSSVELPLSTDKRLVYVVANSKEYLKGVPVNDSQLVGADNMYKYSLADIRMMLTTRLATAPGSDSFVTGIDIPTIPVPMSGVVRFDGGLASNAAIDAQLVRSVSKISVSTPLAASKFQIVGLTLCNGEQTGGILPPANSGTDTQGTARMAYTIDADSVLYAYPTAVGGTSNPPVSIVVEARYEGMAQSSFYRLLISTDLSDENKGIPLQRNHHYLVKINRVDIKGSDNLQAAIASSPANVDYSVTENNNYSNVTLIGGKMFAVDFEQIMIYADSVEQITVATMRTNYPLSDTEGQGTITVDDGLILQGSTSFMAKDTLKTFIVKVTSRYSHPEHSDENPKGIHVSLGSYNKILEVIRKPSRDIHPSSTLLANVSDIKFIASSGDNSAWWMNFSSAEKYSPFDVHTVMDKEQLVRSGYKAYVQIDENLNGDYREVIFETTSKDNKRMRNYLRQEGTGNYVMGFFGGTLESTSVGGVGVLQYSKQLLVEAYEENEDGLTLFGAKQPATTDEIAALYALFEKGKNSTILLAKTYESPAALYCLNKNRDTNGNGTIDDSEVLWYLPGIRQGIGIVLYQAFSANLSASYWSSSYSSNNKVKGVWSMNTAKNSGGYSVFAETLANAASKKKSVRCVRDY